MTTSLSTKLAALTLAASLVALPSLTFAQASEPAAASAPAATEPAAAPMPPPPVPAVTKETVDNPYGLSALWAQGDFVGNRLKKPSYAIKPGQTLKLDGCG